MIRQYSWRFWCAYERNRRAGVVIDYAYVFNADERATIAEHSQQVPWAYDVLMRCRDGSYVSYESQRARKARTRAKDAA